MIMQFSCNLCTPLIRSFAPSVGGLIIYMKRLAVEILLWVGAREAKHLCLPCSRDPLNPQLIDGVVQLRHDIKCYLDSICWTSKIAWIYHVQITFNPPDAEAEIFWEIQVNAMAVDALAPCIPISSSAMVLAMLNKQFLVFYKGLFQLPLQIESWESVENVILCFFN